MPLYNQIALYIQCHVYIYIYIYIYISNVCVIYYDCMRTLIIIITGMCNTRLYVCSFKLNSTIMRTFSLHAVEPTLELTTSGSSVMAAVETCGAVKIRIILRDASANRQVEISE